MSEVRVLLGTPERQEIYNMNTFQRMTETQLLQGWSTDAALFVALDFISSFIQRGQISLEDFETHLNKQIEEDNAPLPLSP